MQRGRNARDRCRDQQDRGLGRHGRAGRARHEAGDENLQSYSRARSGPHARARHGRAGAGQSGRGEDLSRGARMMLCVETITSSYGRIAVLRDASLNVARGEMVALIGSNGAGKTTLLRAISGVQPIGSGMISFDGKPINRLSAHARVSAGIAQVPEGRQVFAPLPVADNLRLGAWTRGDPDIDRDLDEVYTTFPALAEKRQI